MMKDIPYELANETWLYDPDTGEIKWKNPSKFRRKNLVAGYTGKNGCKSIRFNGFLYLSHRIAWLLYYKKWPTYEIDHINHNKADNRICNLRDVTKSTNMENLIKAKTSSATGKLGTFFDKKLGRYRAAITTNRKSKHLGCFDTADEAYAAYIEAKRRIHAGNTL